MGEVAQQRQIALQHADQLVQPRFGMVVGRLAGHQAEVADGQTGDVLGGHVEGALEFRVRDDDVGAQQAGQVEGLGGRGEFHAVHGVALPQVREHRDLVAGVFEVGVDLVGQDRHAVLDADVRQAAQFVGAPDAADRVVRVAQHDGGAARVGGLGLQVLVVHHVAAVLKLQRVVQQGQAVVAGGGHERRVGRALHDHAVAGVGHGAQGRVDGRHDAVGERDPFGLDAQRVAAPHPAHQGIEILVGGVVVAEDVMLGGVDQRLHDLGGGLELHIGHGQGDDILIARPHIGFDHVPLGRGRAPAVHQRLEIVHASLLLVVRS